MAHAGDELRFESYQPGNETEILALFRLSFGRDLPLADWTWRFQSAPAGAGVIELAWSGATLAGHYAVTPLTLSVDGTDFVTALSGTTMTHPDFRGRGLFPRLAERCYARMERDGMAAVWGFPNTNSHRGFIQDVGWTDIAEIPVFRWKTSASTTTAAVEEVDDIDEGFDALWERTQTGRSNRILVRRDRRYLTWRYRRNPSQVYRVATLGRGTNCAGYVVFKRYERELQIVDGLALDEASWVALVEYVMSIAARDELAAVALWLNFTTALHRTLERRGFRPDASVTYFGARPLAGSARDRLLSPHHWDYSMGDSDVY